jgi:hypothetical protein
VIGIASVLALTGIAVLCRNKISKFLSKNKSELPRDNGKTTTNSVTALFQNKEEAIGYFKRTHNVNLHIEGDNLKWAEGIDKSLTDLKNLGIESFPENIGICPFKDNLLKKYYKKVGLPDFVEPVDESRFGFHLSEGGITKGIFFNQSKNSLMEYTVHHEIGHYLHKPDYYNGEYKYVIPDFTDVERINQALSDACNEVKPYTGDKTPHEFIAETFAKMTHSKRVFSDKTMLVYSLLSGPEIPKLKINGKNYADYIAELYERIDQIL